MSESFWVIPSGIAEKSPLTILREQADKLTEVTRGRLRGRVSTSRYGDDLLISLSVAVPALDGYTVEILQYRQPPVMYPGYLQQFGETSSVKLDTEQQFTDALKQILGSASIQRKISALLAQSDAA
jgi:hypothetical protein